jgi:hypothetical protein
MVGVCEYDNKPSNPTKGEEFLRKINNNQVYKYISVP